MKKTFLNTLQLQLIILITIFVIVKKATLRSTQATQAGMKKFSKML